MEFRRVLFRSMSSRGARIVLPANLLQEIDELVGIGARTEFITGLARREVHRLRLLRFLGGKPAGWALGTPPPPEKRRTGRPRREARFHPRPRTAGSAPSPAAAVPRGEAAWLGSGKTPR